MTKKELFSMIEGKSASYCNSMFHLDYERTNNDYIAYLKNEVKQWNDAHPNEKPHTVVVTDSTIEIGSQIWRLAKPAKTGTISVHSDHIKACGVRINKSDIDMNTLTENSFKTIHGSTIVF
jgi:hypothetical protein